MVFDISIIDGVFVVLVVVTVPVDDTVPAILDCRTSPLLGL